MFLDTGQFSFVRELEAAWTDVRDECLALPESTFEPWVQREMYGEGWSVYGLIAFGKRIEEALKSCPRTAALLTRVPGLTTAGFSRMAPGTHIKSHMGWVETVYRLHMGLVVPPDCALRVGNEIRSWREGECLVFDDTVEHEAWNESTETRVVLLLDFLRPGFTSADADVPPAEVEALIQQRTNETVPAVGPRYPSPPPYYHGTRADLKVGDLIGPGYVSNYGKRKKANHVYFAATLEAAIWGAELAAGEGDGRIYIVEPTGAFVDDPNLTDKKFPGNPTKSYRSREPVTVIGEVKEWEGHSSEALQAMKDHLERLKQLGIEAVDD